VLIARVVFTSGALARGFHDVARTRVVLNTAR
jgi:hypothetical protein